MLASKPTMNDRAYLSFLATDDFLPGVRVLADSLRKSGSSAPLLVLVTDNVSNATRAELDALEIATREIPRIPFPPGLKVREERWRNNYSKLHIFGQSQFRKAVYLDADMLVCANLDGLFERPHMSAVNAGGMLWRNRHWTGLNAGLMVIEPSEALFQRMASQIGIIDSMDMSDQGFLNSFYPDWPRCPELHLDHAYNQFHVFLDAHRFHFGYRIMRDTIPTEQELAHPKFVKVIHYISPHKPWLNPDATRRSIMLNRLIRPQMAASLKLWLRFDQESTARSRPAL
jgi:glycogenin glucosyltransferase